MASNNVDDRTRKLVEQSSAVILATHVEPKDDMIAERKRASFNSQELAAFINGGNDKLKRLGELAEILANTEWGDKSRRYYWTRPEEYVGGLKAALGIVEMMKSKKFTYEDGLEARKLVNLPGGFELHIGMFIPTLLSQADMEQQAEWLPKALGLRLVGTYAQTELGHGTFVRGLETTATYDPQTDEFVVHSPTLSSTKWWPGGLGKTSTHVVLMARLFVKGKDYGPHAFVVQIRDMQTHLPLPGVTVGDIGPKFGYPAVDNGFLSFEFVRIPRRNMLMKYAQVTEQGEYVPPPPSNSKASYATMVYVRATIVEDAGLLLARALTIAVRYTAVRRQTAPRPGEMELQVLDYQNTANDLLPLVATAYALIFMGKSAMEMYRKFETERDRGDFSILPELHGMLSGMKAVSTWLTSDGCEACRRTCGGHGYSQLSGLPSVFTNYVQNVTWEGDNNVMCLQTARYLVKGLLGAREGKPQAPSVKYLESATENNSARSPVATPGCWLNPDHQLAALRHRAAALVVQATQTLSGNGNGKIVFEGAPWNNSTVDLIRAARGHCDLVLHSTFISSVANLKAEGSLSPPTIAVLEKLVALFGVSTINNHAGDLLEIGYLTGPQALWVRQQQYALLAVLRPEAVALVDSFGLSDYLLNSALGRYDGDVYRDLLARAKVSPLNDTQEGPGWHGVLQPMLNRKGRDDTMVSLQG
eukprot:jgi/Botrbrau1/2788/Bobra.0125s0001.1